MDPSTSPPLPSPPAAPAATSAPAAGAGASAPLPTPSSSPVPPLAAEAPAVEVSGLTRTYGDRTALAGLDLSVRRGEIFGLLGPNGGGKTTLFRILSTLLSPTSGSARVLGLAVDSAGREIRKRIGVVFQSPSLDKKLKVVENLRHQGRLYGLRGADLEKRIADLLARFRVTDRAGEIVEKLSGGLARRVDIARGLLHSPELLLLDEPTTGLDPGARIDLWEHLRDLKAKQGITLLVTTHLMDDAEKCDRLAIIDRGRVVAVGAPHELRSRIGGDIITVGGPAPETLRDRIREKFGGEPTLLDGQIRMERKDGARFVPELIEAFSGAIDTVTVGKPTLEDV
ncbi:MAG: ATP-binding cassette domain-containing protein, partial [Planctomycetes bacterium]|nr:ATP-binding cassette domain-containing protein [Planctomycetota bacterium]